MSRLTRFGVSMDEELLQQFDQWVSTKGYVNRSEAVRDLVKQALVEQAYELGEREVAGTITLIYPYRLKLKSVPTAHHPSLFILANLQVHLDRETCLKVMVVRGQASEITSWANQLLGLKGVHGRFSVSSTEDIYRSGGDPSASSS